MRFTFLQVLVLVGVINSVLVFVSSRSLRKGYRNTAGYIGIYTLLVSLGIASYSILPVLRNSYDWFCLIRFPALYFIGPLFVFFIKSATDDDYRVSVKDYVYLIPGALEVLCVVFIWIYVYFFDFAARDQWLNSQLFWVFHEGLAIVLAIFFAIKGIRLFQRKRRTVIAFYRNVFYGMMAILSLWVIYYLIELSHFPGRVDSIYYYPFWIANLAFYLFVGYRSIVNPKKPTDRKLLLEESVAFDAIIDRLNQRLKDEELYLQPDINSRVLADRLNIGHQRLNEALRRKNTTFSDMVNRLRIDHFIEKLKQDQDELHTLDYLAKESGFKSRATFYRVFKNHMGMTPTAYKEALVNDRS